MEINISSKKCCQFLPKFTKSSHHTALQALVSAILCLSATTKEEDVLWRVLVYLGAFALHPLGSEDTRWGNRTTGFQENETQEKTLQLRASPDKLEPVLWSKGKPAGDSFLQHTLECLPSPRLLLHTLIAAGTQCSFVSTKRKEINGNTCKTARWEAICQNLALPCQFWDVPSIRK